MRFAFVLEVLALVVGAALIVFSPGPVPTQRYYASTWPPGIAIVAVASIGVGLDVRRRRRRRLQDRLGTLAARAPRRASGSSSNLNEERMPTEPPGPADRGGADSADADENAPGCDDLDAPHDIAALEEGYLSPEGIQRLARHVKQCMTCRLLVVWMIVEAVPAKGTGVHAAVDEPEQS